MTTDDDDAGQDFDVFAAAGRRVLVGGRALRVRPLVLRDWKEVGERLAVLIQPWITGESESDGSIVGALGSHLPDALCEIFARVCVDEEGAVIDAAWLMNHLTGMAGFDVLEALVEVNEFDRFLPRYLALRKKFVGEAAGDGPTSSTPSETNTDGATSGS